MISHLAFYHLVDIKELSIPKVADDRLSCINLYISGSF